MRLGYDAWKGTVYRFESGDMFVFSNNLCRDYEASC